MQARAQVFVLLGLLYAAHSSSASLTTIQPAGIRTSHRGCLEESLSNPRWEVSNLTVEAVPEAAVALTIGSKATGSTTKCVGSTRNETWAKCANSQVSFLFNSDNGTLTIKEAWECPEYFTRRYDISHPLSETGYGAAKTCTSSNPDRLSFVGTGTAAASNSSSTPFIVPASLLSPISISPAQPSPSPLPPPPAANASCNDLSLTPSWTVEDFFFSPVPFHLWIDISNWHNLVRVNVTNRVTGLRTDCTVYPYNGGSDVHAHIWQLCSHVYPDPQLEVLYDGRHGNLGLRQTWSCTDDGMKAITNYTATGWKLLDVNCTMPHNCTTYDPQVLLPGTHTGARANETMYGALEPRAHHLPHSDPYGPSCTLASLNMTTLTLAYFAAETKWDLRYKGPYGFDKGLYDSATFRVAHPTLEFGVGTINHWWGPNETNDVWHDCEAWGGVDRGGDCSWRFNNETREFGVRVGWFCDDRDPEHAVVFRAEGHAKLDLDCAYVQDRPSLDAGLLTDGIRCNMAQPVELAMNLSWNTTGWIDWGPEYSY